MSLQQDAQRPTPSLDALAQTVRRAESRKIRRTALVGGIVIVGAVVTMVFWATATWQEAERAMLQANVARVAADKAEQNRQLAELNRQAAEKSFQLVLQSTEKLVQDIALKLTSGTLPVAAAGDLLNSAQETLSRLDQIQPTPEITTSQIRLLLTLSDAQASLGDSSQALALATRAKELADTIAGSESQRLVFRANYRVGDVFALRGETSKALEAFLAALSTAEHAQGSNPDDVFWVRELAFIHSKIGDVFRLRGDLESALREYRISMALAERLLARHPNAADAKRDLAAAMIRTADTLAVRGDRDGALKGYEQALAVRRELVGQDSANASLQSDVALVLTRIGDLLFSRGEFEKASSYHQESLRIREALALRDPSNAVSQSLLATARIRVGDVFNAMGNVEAALAQYRGALTVREKLAGRDPQNASWQRNVAENLLRVGAVLSSEESNQALEVYRRAVSILEVLAAKSASPLTSRLIEDAQRNIERLTAKP